MLSTRANAAIITARKHLGAVQLDNSARFCLADVIKQYDLGNYDAAFMWAKKSIAYSIGVSHAEYLKFTQ